jgi:hypothetical protein
VAEALRKKKDDGSAYSRPPDVETAIGALLALARDELVQKCKISVGSHPDCVKSQCILHLVGLAKSDNNDRHFESLFRILRLRVQRALPAIERAVEEGDKASLRSRLPSWRSGMPSYFASRNYCASTGRAMMSATNIAPLNRARQPMATISSPGRMHFSWPAGSTRRPRRSACATRPACCQMSAGAHLDYRAQKRGAHHRLSQSRRGGGVSASPLRSLLTMRQIIRARVLGAAMCIAYYLSASTPGVLWHWCLVVN